MKMTMNKQSNSEHILSNINQNIFFKEFTFYITDFYPPDGKKELADNIVWIDEIFFVFQVKERNPKYIKTAETENKWFSENVIKEAKNQIKNSIEYLQTYKDIPITNGKGHVFNAADADFRNIIKIIIYMPNSSLLSNNSKNMKFYESNQIGIIHILNIEDYEQICKYLVTPAELDEYFRFRERLYKKHRDAINTLSEHYILSHFLNTDDESKINQEYFNTFTEFEFNSEEFKMSLILDSFSDKIINKDAFAPNEYYSVIKEIAKLKRFELKEFKIRFSKTIQDVKLNKFSMPYRITIYRTECGFVFIPLVSEFKYQWKNAIVNFTSSYKYKKKLNKCVGLIVFKTGSYYDINWILICSPWVYNKQLEDEIKKEYQFYGDGQDIEIERYKKVNT